MPLTEETGDLISAILDRPNDFADAHVAHGETGQLLYGAGFSKRLKETFGEHIRGTLSGGAAPPAHIQSSIPLPDAESEADEEADDASAETLPERSWTLYTLIVKTERGVYLRLPDLQSCFNLLARTLPRGTTLHMPRIGCGQDGRNWERDVRPLVEEELAPHFDVHVWHFQERRRLVAGRVV